MGETEVAEYPSTRAQLVADAVTTLIIENGMQPGDALPAEGALAERYKVSKTVVREGLSQLVGLGIIESRKGTVATVRHLTEKPLEAYFSLSMRQEPHGLRQAIELRRALEEYVAAIAARQVTDADIRVLRQRLGQLYVTRDLDDEWAMADAEFHRQILHIADNATMGRLLVALNGALWETVSGVRKLHHPQDTIASFKRHEAIFNALAARDPEQARLAMQAHFDAMTVAVSPASAVPSEADH